jgi:hypothetical protein
VVDRKSVFRPKARLSEGLHYAPSKYHGGKLSYIIHIMSLRRFVVFVVQCVVTCSQPRNDTKILVAYGDLCGLSITFCSKCILNYWQLSKVTWGHMSHECFVSSNCRLVCG